MPHMTKTNMTKANATHATKAKETKAKATLGKRSYAAKMLRKYERIVDKRNRDKGILLDRKFKNGILEIEVI